MKNKEKFAKEIFNIACSGDSIAITMTNNEIVPCKSIECGKCIFKVEEHEECSDKIKKWCESEYVEKPTLTSKEKKFLDLLLPEYNYIARDYNTGKLSLYKNKPFKYRTRSWISQSKDFAYELPYACALFGVEFDFIEWEDEEPWSIKDLKKLEVKE